MAWNFRDWANDMLLEAELMVFNSRDFSNDFCYNKSQAMDGA